MKPTHSLSQIGLVGKSLSISNMIISQDKNGFFSLNDLHRASGAEKKHQPSNFMRNTETQELIKAIERENSNSSNLMSIAYTTTEGKKGGTFVCRELVYRYAMWISPKFSLMVIRAFDVLNTGAIPALGNVRHTISIEQQATIRQAVAKRCQSNSTHYQSIYTALHTKFGIPRYDELLAVDYDAAMAFIEQYQLADNMPNNAFWRMVGILEYERLSREIDALEQALDSASAHLNHIKRTKGLLYDAFGEQRHISHDPNLTAKARAFIDAQMAMKRRIGFI